MPLILLSTTLLGSELEDTAAPILPMAVAMYTLGRWRRDLLGLVGMAVVALAFFCVTPSRAGSSSTTLASGLTFFSRSW